jgi:molybdopterin-guanine dinucleotide biosynthesis protein B
MKVVGFAGYSGSGKTTLVEQLIPRLRARGLRVSVVKHAHHRFDIDHPGKDTFRHREAGAFEVVVASEPAAGADARVRAARPSCRCTICSPSCGTAWTGCWSKAFAAATCSRSRSGAPPPDQPARYPEDDFIAAIATDDPAALPVPTLRPVLDLNDARSHGPVADRQRRAFRLRPRTVSAPCLRLRADRP